MAWERVSIPKMNRRESRQCVNISMNICPMRRFEFLRWPRLAQVFRIEASDFGGFRDAVISTEFLMEHTPDKLGKVLKGWRVVEHLRSVKGTEVTVTTWGIEEKDG